MGAADCDLHELQRADRMGIDAPLGWSVLFAQAVAKYLTHLCRTKPSGRGVANHGTFRR